MQDKIRTKSSKVQTRTKSSNAIQIRTKSSKVNKLDLISGRHTDIMTERQKIRHDKNTD